MLKNYPRIALRNLWKEGIYSIVNIAGLAVGMVSVILILTWVQNERSFNRYHTGSKNVYRAFRHYTNTEGINEVWGVMPYPLAAAAEENIPEIQMSAQLFGQYPDQVFHVNGRSFNDRAAYIGRNWFELFDYEFVQGSPEIFFNDPFSLILTQSVARQHFGNENPVGEAIRIGKTIFVVRGIVNDPPSNSSFQYNYLIPIEALMSDPEFRDRASTWGMHGFVTFFLLQNNADTDRLEDRLTALYSKNHPVGSSRVSLQALEDLYFDRRVSEGILVHGNIQNVRIFSAIGLLILIIACFNYINLSMARASVRRKGTGVRKMAGASRTQLFLQFMTESALASFASLLLAFLLIVLLLPVLNSMTGNSAGAFKIGSRLMIISGGIFFVTLILAGAYPSMALASVDSAGLLKNAGGKELKGLFLRKPLVVVQFVISISLISGTVVMREQFQFIRARAPGEDLSRIFVVQPPFPQLRQWLESDQLSSKINSFKEAIASRTGVEDVIVASESIVDIENSGEFGFYWEGKSPEYNPLATFIFTEPGFFDFFGLKMASGRWYRKQSSADRSAIVMNEAAVKTFGVRRPAIGQRFTFPSSEFQKVEGNIIGVVKDFHFRSLHEKIGPLLIVNDHPGYSGKIFVKSGTDHVANALSAAENVWDDFFPETPFSYSFLDVEFEALYRADHQQNVFFAIFAGVGIFISCLGLFGLTLFSVLQRTREVGIRKVLGASVGGITVLLSLDFIKLVGIAILVATPLAWLVMNRWLQDFAYRIELQWWMFAIAGLLAVVIALLTVSVQSVKAALVNPVKSLKSE